MDKEKKDKLKDYLEKGLIHEIYLAEESYFILQTITKNWNELSKNNFGIFFNSLYSAHFIRYSLAITKLFDKPHSKYEVVSLLSVISYIKENFLDETIQQKPLLVKQLANRGFNVNYIIIMSDRELINTIISYFEEETPTGNYNGNVELEGILEIIRKYRDKHYAHKENIDPKTLPKTTFEDSQKLLSYAKAFVSTFGLAFFSTIYSVDGKDYVLSDDARMINNAFIRLLEQADFNIKGRKKYLDDF